MIALIDSLKKKIFFFCACILFIALLLSFAQAAGYIQNNLTIKEYEKKNGISDGKKIEEINSYLERKKSEIQKTSLAKMTGMATEDSGQQETSNKELGQTLTTLGAVILFVLLILGLIFVYKGYSFLAYFSTCVSGSGGTASVVCAFLFWIAVILLVVGIMLMSSAESNPDTSKMADDQKDGPENGEDNSNFRCQQTIRAGKRC